MNVYKYFSALMLGAVLALAGCSKEEAVTKVETKDLGVVNVNPNSPTTTDLSGGRTCEMSATVIQPNIQLRVEVKKGSKSEEFASLVVPSDKPAEVTFKTVVLKFTPHLTQ